jgi:hypothetical protein
MTAKTVAFVKYIAIGFCLMGLVYAIDTDYEWVLIIPGLFAWLVMLSKAFKI